MTELDLLRKLEKMTRAAMDFYEDSLWDEMDAAIVEIWRLLDKLDEVRT